MDAATVGGAFLSASLQVLFDRIASRDVLTVLRGHKLSPTLLRKLKINLLAVQAVLDDAEAKQFTSSAVRQWVDELKHAVYDAEDLLDDITTEALRSAVESEPLISKVRTIISSFLSSFGVGIQSRTEEITTVLETLANQKDALGLKQGFGERLPRRWPATCLVDESAVYGRRDDKDEIVRFLLSDDASGSNVSVIALVGMGGIGKTTLANLVYREDSVEKFFELKAWVCVSDEFDLVKITKTILKTFDSATPDDNDLNQLQLKLKERLSRKKFLLVLDDVWNESFNNWDLLQTPFIVGLNGSKIIVTTRSDRVASIMRSVHIHHLEQLSFEDCWSLFAKYAFENGDPSPHPKLEEIGKEIVKKCKGLPLAAKTLGATLYSELRVKKWKNILRSEIWDSPNDDILPALRLSYDHLPSQLKRCFAYCSIFPKDHEFEKERLMLLWMAEGFLEQSQGMKTMEDVGDVHFEELLSRSFFQKSSTHKSYFIMHDLVHDLAQHVSRKFSLQYEDGKTCTIPEVLRHLSIFTGETDVFKIFHTVSNRNGLRTLLFSSLGYLEQYHWDDFYPNYNALCNFVPFIKFKLNKRVVNDLFSKAQNLRVLSLCHHCIVDLPDAIGNLKHLRYLELSHTSIKCLPNSVCSLYHLQTLILSFCHQLVELPRMMSKLTRLRHLDIRHSEVKKMPSQMCKLNCLLKLNDYRVGKKSGTRIGELRELSRISGILHVKELQNVVNGKDAMEANLVGKQYIDDLRLEWNEASGVEQNGADEVVLNNLQPHPNLKRLTIQGYGGSRFADWLGGPEVLTNLVSLRLSNCKDVSSFPPFGQLSCLAHLYICGAKKVERVGAEFYGTDSSSSKPPFASLKALSFVNMPKWNEWVCGGGQGRDFPRLEELDIVHCPELTGGLPDHLPLLTSLEIRECERLVAPLPKVPSIRQLNMVRSGGVFLRNNASRDFICLESLTTSNVSQWKELPPLWKVLCIENDDSVESALEGILQSHNRLQSLRILYCSFSRALGRVCLPLALKSLNLNIVENAEFLLNELFKCQHPFLERLDIVHGTCNSISSCFPLSIFPRLTSLQIHSLKGLQSLSFTISDEGTPPTSLEHLYIIACPNLVSVDLPALINLSTYCIYNCKNLESLLHNNASFRSLSLEYCPELIFPIQDLPASLSSLTIRNCKKLTSQMEVEGQGVASLTSLTHIDIDGGFDKRKESSYTQFCRCLTVLQ